MNERDATLARHGCQRTIEDRLEALERSTQQLERRIADINAPARPDPVPLLRQAWLALVGFVGCERGCMQRELAQAERARDAIAAAYPEVTK